MGRMTITLSMTSWCGRNPAADRRPQAAGQGPESGGRRRYVGTLSTQLLHAHSLCLQVANFEAAYTSNRAPMPIWIHTPWFTERRVAQLQKFAGGCRGERGARRPCPSAASCSMLLTHAPAVPALPDCSHVNAQIIASPRALTGSPFGS